jgi:hypothetical protein
MPEKTGHTSCLDRVDFDYYIGILMKKPGALKGSVALKQMPEKMQELFRVHFAENGKDFLKLLKYCRDNKYDYKDILDAVRNFVYLQRSFGLVYY